MGRSQVKLKSRHEEITTQSFFRFGLGSSVVSAATLYWVGANGANASVASNWKTINPAACGGGDAGAAPTTTDTMNFDADCDNGATIDADFGGVVTSVTINSDYIGTVTLARSLQTTSAFTTSGGVFNASNQTLDVDGTFTMNTGSTVRASSVTMYFGNAFTINGGTFDIATNPGGTVEFDGASNNLNCNSIAFNLFVLNSGTNTKTIGNDCSLSLGSNPTASRFILNGTLSGTGTLNLSSHTNFNSGAALSGFGGISSLSTGTFTVAGATLDLSSYSSFIVNGLV